METTLDFNNINVASSILEATNTDSRELLTVYPDLETLASIAKSSKAEKAPIIHTFNNSFSHSLVENETQNICPGLSSLDKDKSTLIIKEESSSLNDSAFKLKCHICYCTFTNELKYKIHQVKHQHAVHIICNYCGKKIACNHFVYHVMVHTGEKPHICNICGRGFRLRRDLRQHNFTHTGEKPYQCDICGKRFADASSRRKHLQIHTGEKPYSCEICERSFTQISHLRDHQVTHTKQKLHACELCLKTFTTKSSMQRHMLTHDNTCEVCNSTFTTNNKLQKHKELHDAERPFSCKICQRRFRKRTDLKTHMVVHSNEKNIICKICKEAFKSFRYLRVHYASYHKDLGPPFRCNICLKGFFQDKSVKQHYAAHFNDSTKRAKCPQCSITFSGPESLKKHTNLNNCNILTCLECDSQFNSKDDLVHHLKSTHNLFSDNLIVPDITENSIVSSELILSKNSVEKSVENHTKFVPSFEDSSNSSIDGKLLPAMEEVKPKVNKFLPLKCKIKSMHKNEISKSCENSKLPTIVKVEIASNHSSDKSLFNEFLV